MTARARITQADIERTVKSLKAAGIRQYRLIMHLDRGEIEVIVGDTTRAIEAVPEANPWDDLWTDDDV